MIVVCLISLFTADLAASLEAMKSDIDIQASLFTAVDLLARQPKERTIKTRMCQIPYLCFYCVYSLLNLNKTEHYLDFLVCKNTLHRHVQITVICLRAYVFVINFRKNIYFRKN